MYQFAFVEPHIFETDDSLKLQSNRWPNRLFNGNWEAATPQIAEPKFDGDIYIWRVGVL